MFEGLKDNELPRSWDKAGRHSTQGFRLTDLVGYVRVISLAQDLYARKRNIMTWAKARERLLLRLDNRFRSHFFARRFGDCSMVEAATMYVTVLERQLHPLESKDQDLRIVLHEGTPTAFYRWCLQWREPMPTNAYQALCLIHNLRVGLQKGVSLEDKRASRDWLEQHPEAVAEKLL